MIKYEGISFEWLGHDGFIITTKMGKTICIDPYNVKGSFKPVDILISTHEHGDHCSPQDLKKFASKNTILIGIEAAKEKLSSVPHKELNLVKPYDKMSIETIDLEFVPAYNVNKFRSPGVPFHPKKDGKIGVILVVDGIRIYHAGDTDIIPEMKDFKPDIALLPVSGTYVMTFSEAIKAVSILKPKLAIPMHFGTIVGDIAMAESFKTGAECKVIIPTKS
ncbi:MAG: MBL fold metallo-hydrolase [Candidatus Hodarchaeales archaeon]